MTPEDGSDGGWLERVLEQVLAQRASERWPALDALCAHEPALRSAVVR
jgi:hypothetical protein